MKEPSNSEERQTEEVNRIFAVLKRRYRENGMKPLCYYKFVINPHSYCYTIENIFHTSFLVNLYRAHVIEGKTFELDLYVLFLCRVSSVLTLLLVFVGRVLSVGL